MRRASTGTASSSRATTTACRIGAATSAGDAVHRARQELSREVHTAAGRDLHLSHALQRVRAAQFWTLRGAHRARARADARSGPRPYLRHQPGRRQRWRGPSARKRRDQSRARRSAARSDASTALDRHYPGENGDRGIAGRGSARATGGRWRKTGRCSKPGGRHRERRKSRCRLARPTTSPSPRNARGS